MLRTIYFLLRNLHLRLTFKLPDFKLHESLTFSVMSQFQDYFVCMPLSETTSFQAYQIKEIQTYDSISLAASQKQSRLCFQLFYMRVFHQISRWEQ